MEKEMVDTFCSRILSDCVNHTFNALQGNSNDESTEVLSEAIDLIDCVIGFVSIVKIISNEFSQWRALTWGVHWELLSIQNYVFFIECKLAFINLNQ